MKKYSWIIALILALSMAFVFIGCGGDDNSNSNSSDDGGSPSGAPPIGGTGDAGENFDNLWDSQWVDGKVSNLPTSVTLGDNFIYGTGYQYKLSLANYLDGNLKVNDVFQIEIEFTVSRDLEDKLQWCLVNDSANAPNPYWTELSRWKTITQGDDKTEGPVEESTPEPPHGTTIVPSGDGFKATDTVSYVGRVVVARAAPKNDSKLVFDTKGSGKYYVADSGVKKPVTLTFTKFKLTKLAWGEAPAPATYTVTNLAFAKGSDPANFDVTTGKGNIEGEDVTLLKAARAGSFVRMTFDLTSYDGSVGWGFGTIGNGNNNLSLTAKDVSAPYTEDIPIEDFLQGVSNDQSWVFINVWEGAKVTKVELHAID